MVCCPSYMHYNHVYVDGRVSDKRLALTPEVV